jgi:hypothetical protein
MFSYPGGFFIYDYSVIVDINEFFDGKCSVYPSPLEFSMHLLIDKVM